MDGNPVSRFVGRHLPLMHKAYYRLVSMGFPDGDVTLPLNGMRILVRNPRKSVIGGHIYWKGVWEPEVTKFVSSVLRPDMTVLDVGADIGYYTLIFAKLVGPGGRVFSFEPIPKAKEYLDRNVELNGLSNVRTMGFALYDKAGTTCLEKPFRESEINPSKETPTGDDIKVEMKVFDEWKTGEEVGRVDAVKIDVEGAELNVLRGMAGTLEGQHPAVLVEVHPRQLARFGFTAADVLEFLSGFGYRVEPVDRDRVDFSGGEITLFCR